MQKTPLLETLPFRYNQDIKYTIGPLTTFIRLYDGQDIQVIIKEGDSFRASFTDIFEKYIRPPITTEADMNLCNNNPMQFWQNQINFAIWCATAGCGVSIKFHFNHEDKMVRLLYRFHIYYMIRKDPFGDEMHSTARYIVVCP